MTKLLEQAFAQASKLPPAEQEALASLILSEIESEQRWSDAFAHSQNQLSSMADDALAEFDEGKTLPFE